jgi:hypothetical protein
MTEKWNVEHTDTYSGQANYCWVDRQVIEVRPGSSQQAIMRVAKAAVGLTGVPGRTMANGVSYEFRPYRACEVLFVDWHDDDEGIS